MRDTVLPVLNTIEQHFDRWKARLGRKLKSPGLPYIQTYRGFGTEASITVEGRLLEDPRLRKPGPEDSVVDNIVSAFRRFESDEIPGARLRVSFAGTSREVTTDEEGYFIATLAPQSPIDAASRWHQATVTLLEWPGHVIAENVEASAPVLIPPLNAQFGVISDIDDTILKTGATDFIGMVRTTLTGNALTRLPFEGVAAFYRALSHGDDDTFDNPLFFVSSSPWNLYDLLVDFMEAQGIPQGPIALRDLGLDATKFIKSAHSEHKTAAIERVLSCYPDLPFILIGDSGQHDPEIYAAVARAHPGRIRCIYIRDVASAARDQEVTDLAAQLAIEDIEMVLAKDSLEAAQHAQMRGWIRDAELPDVAAEKAKDAAPEHES